MSKHQNKERGAWLSILLIFIMTHGAFATFLVLDFLKQQYAPSRPIILVSLIFISVATFISAIAIWFWKKWGLYLYVISTIVSMAMHLIMTGSLLVLFYDIIPPAILAYLLNSHNRWRYFEPKEE